MERKIGEIFEYNGEWYQCLKSTDDSCMNCDMYSNGKCPIPLKECVESGRSDKSYVIFKKLEKVGEPYAYTFTTDKIYNVLMQQYKVNYDEILPFVIGHFFILNSRTNTIAIEIKQNEEDMKEIKLKPFDLEAAKAGKPVCTRDGRKARIICFDRICGDDYYKIVACVTAFDGDFEEVLSYGIDGYIVDSQNPKDEDLMKLPEKKEGWVNIYDDMIIYESEEEAKIGIATARNYIATTKVEWEE